MIKIDNIKIKGYKNIKSADLKLSNLNVVVGANNSGKSNFIQAISFLNFMVNASLDDVEKGFTKGFGFNYTNFKQIIPSVTFSELIKANNLKRNGVIEFELAFSNSETDRLFTYCIIIEWDSSLIESEFKIKKEKLDVKEAKKTGPAVNIFSRHYDVVKYGTEFSKMDRFETVLNHFSIIRVLKILTEVKEDYKYKDAVNCLNEILKTPIFYFSLTELLKADKERQNSFNGRVVSFELEKEIIALEEGSKWSIFNEALKNILNIDTVTVNKYNFDNNKLPVTKILTFLHNKKNNGLSQFSDGTLLILALVTKILSTENHIFLIEEPENSIHPKALVDLINFLKSFSEEKQFIITTHSIALINTTQIEDIIVSSCDEDGLSEFYNVSSKKELKTRLKKSSTNFSDELFFNLEDKNEFE